MATATTTDKLKVAHEKLTAAVESIVSGDESGTLTSSIRGKPPASCEDTGFSTVVDCRGAIHQS